jgi:SAM-dependent MidA family methyltransferase
MQLDLPTPSPAALAHSETVRAHVAKHIQAAGGWISFAEYMNLVLYAPGLGYYSAGANKFGESGDFVTAPVISPVFSQCLAGQCAEVLESLGGGTILEPGAGTGIMAADMLLELECLQALPDEYLILEPGADLRERQLQTIMQRAPHLCERVRWLDSAPDKAFRGVVVANEVLDALPVRRFVLRGKETDELGVALDGTQLVAQCRPADAGLLEATEMIRRLPGFSPADGYESELSMQLPAWIQTVAEWLDEGVALLLDYGFPRHEYYFSERSSGTLRCYYRHRAHEDPLVWPGLQDITAWVDFSFLAEMAMEAGFVLTGFTTQANFLLASGIDERVTALTGGQRAQVEMASGLRQLLLPGEMGESVKVMALSRGGATAPSGMYGRDMRSRLRIPNI